MPGFTERCILFCLVLKQADANAAAEAWGGGPNTFSVPCSATGLEPATHYIASTQCTLAQASAIADALAAGDLVAVYDARDGWDGESAMSDMGLQKIEPDLS